MDSAVASDLFGKAAFLFGSLGQEACGIDEVFVEIVLGVGQRGSPTLIDVLAPLPQSVQRGFCLNDKV